MLHSFQDLYQAQQRFFHSGATRPFEFRLTQLRKLEKVLRAYEPQIEQALYADLHKHPQEVFTTEVGGIYEEIRLILRDLKNWMQPKRVNHPLYLFPGSSWIYPEPLGIVLIITPWNYPFLLTFRAVVGAMAAGNTIVIKPSEISSHSAALIEQMIRENFPAEYLTVLSGDGAGVVMPLLEQFHFDHIHFTGSPVVGAKIMEKAAKHLSPVSLELGGKSPCIIADDAHLEVVAKRIVWGKMVCTGQTCVAPDYLLVQESVKEKLVPVLIREIERAYGSDAQKSESYGRIINRKRLDTLCAYLSEGRILYGGKFDAEDLYLSPTLLDQVSLEARLMKEEIFGPILPIFTYRTPEEAVAFIERNPYPLSLYVFSAEKRIQQYFIQKIRFGGGAINETVLHLGNSELPFGGISYSGHGSYLGKYSFDAFTNFKSILKRATWLEPGLRHPPFSIHKTKWWRRVLGRP
ncbi:MAG: aldehyde dehydrogenase family protein [Chitinophagaceae bacterium]